MGDHERHAVWHSKVDDRLKTILEALVSNGSLDEKLPGLKSLLNDWLDEHVDVSHQDFLRRLLQVFHTSNVDNTYEDLFAELDPREQNRVSKFVNGTQLEDSCHDLEAGPCKRTHEHLKPRSEALVVQLSSSGPSFGKALRLEELGNKQSIFCKFIRKLARYFRPGKAEDTILVYKNEEFENWGRTVKSLPSYTCVPSSVAAVQHIVRFAKEQNVGIRCSGYRHSWSPFFGRDGQILISFISLHDATIIPNTTSLPLPQSKPTELESIDIVPGTPRKEGNALVRVGVSVTNERLRRWCVQNNKFTLPLNVIMVEITMGGSNGPICHGAGRRHQTLSDLVRKVEYVDCNGVLRVVEDEKHLRAAAGCFGLMGVITHLTLELSPMTYASLSPKKVPMVRAIPPPSSMSNDQIPPALRVSNLTSEQKAQDLATFREQCDSYFYSEWFWFPYSDVCWVNCWNDTDDGDDVAEYPSDSEIFFQFISEFTMNIIQNAKILGELATAAKLDETIVTIFSAVAVLAMPDKPVKTYLTDGLHFQRGIQNIRVLDMEAEIPIPSQKHRPDLPDFEVVQKAWWDAVLTCYENIGASPQRMPLEMRIMGDSNMIMAPQRGNRHGTCSIEVLTLKSEEKIWNEYAQQILDKWMSYTDADGAKLKTRPHWAKQWKGLTVDGEPWEQRMKRVDYSEDIVEFKATLASIGKAHGWTLKDLKERFSNEFFDSFYFDDV